MIQSDGQFGSTPYGRVRLEMATTAADVAAGILPAVEPGVPPGGKGVVVAGGYGLS